MSILPADLKRAVALMAAEVIKLRHTEADVAWRNYIEAKIEWLKEELVEAQNKEAEAAKILLLREMLRDLDLAKPGNATIVERTRQRPIPATKDL